MHSVNTAAVALGSSLVTPFPGHCADLDTVPHLSNDAIAVINDVLV